MIIVNAESLRRGTTEGDELCEIEGIGPVSVAAAKELLSEGGFQYLVKEGFDIKTVTKSTRVIANCIDMALIVRDRVCADRAVGNSLGLERDHRQLDYGQDGPSELDNLVRLCPKCHRLKTDGGWRLEGRPGAWEWVAPAKAPSAQQMARSRKVAVAKAKAKAAFVKEGPERAQAGLIVRRSGARTRRRVIRLPAIVFHEHVACRHRDPTLLMDVNGSSCQPQTRPALSIS